MLRSSIARQQRLDGVQTEREMLGDFEQLGATRPGWQARIAELLGKGAAQPSPLPFHQWVAKWVANRKLSRTIFPNPL